MNTTPAVFQFHTTEIRTIEKDGLVWFVASDIAKALNYADAKQMTRILDDDECGLHTVQTSSSNRHSEFDRDIEVVIINESGLYHALLKSRKPEAQPFRKWVTSEVLPAIRKTGSYTAPTEPLTPVFPVETIKQHIQSSRYIMHFTRDGAMVLKEIPDGARLLRDEDIANVVGDPSCMLDRKLLGGIIRAALNRLLPQ